MTVRDSQAILVYLARRYGDDHWLPNEPAALADVIAWLSTAANEVALGPNRLRLHYKFGRTINLNEAEQVTENLLQILQEKLEQQAWLAGEQITIADIAVYPYVALAPEGRIDLQLYPAILNWIRKIQAIPGYREYAWHVAARIAVVHQLGWANLTRFSSNPKENVMNTNSEIRPPLPPFTYETAVQKVRMAEDGWNGRNPEKVALAYTIDSQWRNRAEFPVGREQIIAFLTQKWAKEHEYRLIKELWAYSGNRIAVRFAYEWHNDQGDWFRSYGNENWEFNEDGLMQRRYACINDLPIHESERKFHWPQGRRPDDHPGLSELGF